MDDLFAAPAEHHSLFFALLPDPATIAGIRRAQRALEDGQPPQRGGGTPDGRLHLTLHWLGEWSQLPGSTVAAARAAAAQLVQAPFGLSLDQAGCFGHGEVVWVLRPSAPPQALGALQVVLRVGRPLVDVPATPRRPLDELWQP